MDELADLFVKACFWMWEGVRPINKEMVEANQIGDRLRKELTRLGKDFYYERKHGNRTVRETIKFSSPVTVYEDRFEFWLPRDLPHGVKRSSLQNEKTLFELSEALERRVDYAKGVVEINSKRRSGSRFVVYRSTGNNKANFNFTDLIPPATFTPEKQLLLCLGRDNYGSQIWDDAKKWPHALYAGTTGNGKSTELNSHICWVLQNYSPQQIQFIMLDLKEGLELDKFNGLPHLMFPVEYRLDDAYKRLKWAYGEVERRGDLFRPWGVTELDEYNAKSKETLPRIVLVIDEVSSLGMMEHAKDAWAILNDLGRRARAVGLHIWVTAQRPTTDVFDSSLKANIPTRICFGLPNGVSSRVVLDSDKAVRLPIGDAIIQSPKFDDLPVRGCMISTEEVKQVIKGIRKKYENLHLEFAEKEKQEQLRLFALDNEIIEHATLRLDGNASERALFEHFKGSITLAELRERLRVLEEQGRLLPSTNRLPRRVAINLETAMTRNAQRSTA